MIQLIFFVVIIIIFIILGLNYKNNYEAYNTYNSKLVPGLKIQSGSIPNNFEYRLNLETQDYNQEYKTIDLNMYSDVIYLGNKL